MSELIEKKKKLENIFSDLGSAAVAFSAGVDSTFLLKTAHDVLGDRAVAVTAVTGSFPERELEEARTFCKKENITLLTVDVDIFSVKGFCENPPDRCYICKKAVFSRLKDIAAEQGIANVAEGSNVDDMKDYRPGMKAVAELGVISPLREAGLTKNDVRALSKEMGLKTWDKPSFACLATRIAYGEQITREKLSMIERGEGKLSGLGFRQYRVRVHGDSARIELLPEDIEKIVDPAVRGGVAEFFHSLGFKHVSVDLDGYRTGSMNAALQEDRL
ncbi:MAG: ATP-dependent sacrificial sulfur transferase LarE [Clostridiales bacterium]|nr:ATP-dependent sacrificial sulfur transferase LarE [Clostridiales bacterium]